MHEKTVAKGCYVIREGELGNHFYVSAEGEYEVIKDGKVLGRLGVGKAFGELAILYNCKRTASIKVTTDSILTGLTSPPSSISPLIYHLVSQSHLSRQLTIKRH